MRALGADVAVDYSQPGWPERVRAGLDGREVSVVLDGVGGELGRDALGLLGPGGRLLLFGMASGSATEVTTRDLMRDGLTVTWALRRRANVRELETRALAEAAAGRLVPLVGSASRSPTPPPRTPRSRPARPRARRCWCPSRGAEDGA